MDAKIENPDLFPTWVYGFAGPETADLRGKAVFELYAEIGMRVVEVELGKALEFQAWKPWTHIFLPVPHVQIPDEMWDWFERSPVSLVLDCHFPLMNLTQAYVIDEPDRMFDIIEAKEIMIENVRRAHAVTVSNLDWVMDIAALNPNTFYLPDIRWEDGEDSIVSFQLKLMEAATATHRIRTSRPCQCRECLAKREAEATNPLP